MRSARRNRVAVLAVWLTAAAAALVTTAGAQGDAGEAAQGVPAAGSTSWLERRVGLAESGQFYLVLDPVPSSLALALGGITLLELPVTGVTALTPRVLFRRTVAPAGWQDTVWLHGTLDPPLPVAAVVPPPTGDTETAEVPTPLPDDLVPAPDVYDVRFEGGLTLRVVAADEGTPRRAGLASAARERWRMLLGESSAVVRLELVMDAEDAGRLYRALPPDIALVMAPRPPTPVRP